MKEASRQREPHANKRESRISRAMYHPRWIIEQGSKMYEKGYDVAPERAERNLRSVRYIQILLQKRILV